jgi:ribosome-associated protein
VVDDDLIITSSVRVPRREIELSFSTSGGAGGQHANRNATRVDLRFDIASSTAFTDAQRARVIAKLGREVRLSVDDRRSQLRNREIAENRLADRLRDALYVERSRRPTKPSRSSQRRRVDAKKRRGETKRQRKKPTGNDW